MSYYESYCENICLFYAYPKSLKRSKRYAYLLFIFYVKEKKICTRIAVGENGKRVIDLKSL